MYHPKLNLLSHLFRNEEMNTPLPDPDLMEMYHELKREHEPGELIILAYRPIGFARFRELLGDIIIYPDLVDMFTLFESEYVCLAAITQEAAHYMFGLIRSRVERQFASASGKEDPMANEEAVTVTVKKQKGRKRSKVTKEPHIRKVEGFWNEDIEDFLNGILLPANDYSDSYYEVTNHFHAYNLAYRLSVLEHQTFLNFEMFQVVCRLFGKINPYGQVYRFYKTPELFQ